MSSLAGAAIVVLFAKDCKARQHKWAEGGVSMPYPDFRVGEALFEESDLMVVDAEDPGACHGSSARPISAGGSGKVFKAIQADVIARAVKVLDPRERFLETRGWADFVQSFKREAHLLAVFTHSHLVKLISWGEIPTGDRLRPVVPFVAMEYVEGRPLNEFIASIGERGSGEQQADCIVDLFDNVLSALEYLHDRDGVHCDVKEANILVRDASRPEAVLVDLGAAHVLTSPLTETTQFYSTPARVSAEWQARIGTSVERAVLHAERTSLDLHMFGSMLRLFLGKRLRDGVGRYDWQKETCSAFRTALSDNSLVVVDRVSEKCIQGAYRNAHEVRQDLTAIRPRFFSPLGVSELSIGSQAKTHLTLPYDSIPLSPRMNATINHPCVQRLSQIPQLDLVRLIYVGATHTRFLHSLETFNLARRYVGTLLADPTFQAYCAEREKLEAVLLAGLLHDIGHYPLEHVFEDFALRAEREGPFSEILRDEDVSSEILETEIAAAGFVRTTVDSYLQQCRAILRNDLVSTLPSLIRELFGERVLTYLRRILHFGSDADRGVLILRSIITGPLDVDKVAYLTTDSRYSGAAYGRAIDVDTLVGSLTCTAGERPGIAIREKGLCAAESIATSRRWMFQRVYWHRTNRAIMAMLRYAPHYLFSNQLLTFPEYFDFAYRVSDIEAVKWIDQRFSHHASDEAGENPAMMILDGRRGIYKAALEFSPTDAREEIAQVRSYLMARTAREWFDLGREIASIANDLVPPVLPSDVLLDIPARRRPRIGDALVVLESGHEVMLSVISDEFRNAQGFFEKGAMSCRVFIHPTLRKRLAASGRLYEFGDATLEKLRERAGR